jgi:hypothetical protein
VGTFTFSFQLAALANNYGMSTSTFLNQFTAAQP